MKRFLPQVTIGSVIILITVLHFLTPVEQVVWHEIYQRLYYIPIITSALLFGLRGGLAASVFTTVVYSPHIFLHWQEDHFDYSINQYAEIIIFNLVGSVMGALGDGLRQAREKAERNAEELQKAYDELQKTFEQLLQAEKLTSLGELSAGIVHEVRNPLGAIRGAVEILEGGIENDSLRREFADLAKKEIERLDKLVGEFLRFARPATLSVELNDLNKIVESVVSLIENQAIAQSVLIEKNLQSDLSKVLVDSEQIKQVLLNIAINSLQAMPDGGKLTFRTFQRDRFLIVEVEDNGIGINEKIAGRIFDPFFTTKEKGVGLGLSVAHKIVSQHKGSLSGENRNGKTVFSLCLPENSMPESRVKNH
jgi:signal transduction histidine kinase